MYVILELNDNDEEWPKYYVRVEMIRIQERVVAIVPMLFT